MNLRLRLFAFLALTYVATLGGHVYSGDELMMVRGTEAIVARGDLSVRTIANFEDYATVSGADGRPYTWYGLGLSLAAIPFYAAGMALEQAVPQEGLAAFSDPKILYYDRNDRAEVIRTFAATWVNPIVTALTVVLLVQVLAGLGVPAGFAVGWGLAFGLTGVTWFYAKTFFSEPLSALAFTGGLAAWQRMRRDDRGALPWAFLTGLSLGGAILARVPNGAFLLPAGIMFLAERVRARPRDGGWKPVLAPCGASAGGVAIPLLVVGAYNALRFGDVLTTGYCPRAGEFKGDFLDGFLGLSIGPGRGFLWYFPWVLLAVPGLALLFRRDRATALYCGGAFAVLWLMYSLWTQWDGGWVYGPRFLVPAFPLLAVAAGVAAWEWWRRAWGKVVILCIGTASLAMAVQSVQVNFVDFHYALWQSTTDVASTIRWSWDWSPMLRYWDFPVRGFMIMPRLALGEGGAALAVLAWLVATGWLASLVALLRGLLRGRVPPSGA